MVGIEIVKTFGRRVMVDVQKWRHREEEGGGQTDWWLMVTREGVIASGDVTLRFYLLKYFFLYPFRSLFSIIWFNYLRLHTVFSKYLIFAVTSFLNGSLLQITGVEFLYSEADCDKISTYHIFTYNRHWDFIWWRYWQIWSENWSGETNPCETSNIYTVSEQAGPKC